MYNVLLMQCIECKKKIINFGKKFCSLSCYYTFRKRIYDEKYTKPCHVCKKNFRHPTVAPNKKTCSRECAMILFRARKHTTESNKRRSKTLKCYWANRIRQGTPHTNEEIEKIKQNTKGINKGEKNGNWRNGASKNLYRGDNWKEVKQQIYERDNRTCQKCGKSGRRVFVHHKIPWRNNMNNNLDNLETLCRSCHTIKDNEIIRSEKASKRTNKSI